MPSEDLRKTAKWDSLFDTYKLKIATLIYNHALQEHNSIMLGTFNQKERV